MTTARELVTALGFDFDDATAQRAEASYKSLRTLALGVAAAAGAIGAALGAATSQAAAHGDRVAKLADRIGVGVEEFQELDHAAQRGGESTEVLVASIRGLAKNIGLAASGSKEIRKVFRDNDIAYRDSEGRVRKVGDVLGDLAERMRTMPDDGRKVALAQRLMEEAGVRLIPMLSAGRAGLEAMRQEARDTGVVMSEEAARQAEVYQDAMLVLRQIVKGLTLELGAGLIPTVIEYAKAAQGWFKANRAIIRQRIHRVIELAIIALEALAQAMRTVWTLGRGLITMFGGLDNVLTAFGIVAGVLVAGQVGQLILSLRTLTVTLRTLTLAQLKAAAVPVIVGASFLALAAIIGLVIDDLTTFSTGGRSLIGRLFDEFLEKPPKADEHWMIKVLRQVLRLTRAAIRGIKELTHLVADVTLVATGDAPEGHQPSPLRREGTDLIRGEIDRFRNDLSAIGDMFRLPQRLRQTQVGGEGFGALTDIGLLPAIGAAAGHTFNNNVSVTVEATTNADPDEIADKATEKVADMLDQRNREAAATLAPVIDRCVSSI